MKIPILKTVQPVIRKTAYGIRKKKYVTCLETIVLCSSEEILSKIRNLNFSSNFHH